MSTILLTVFILVTLGVVSAVVLYYVATKFHVIDDPRIDEVEAVLPAANCGGCGYPGCRAFAENMVKADKTDAFFCPVGGAPVMAQIGQLLGVETKLQSPKVAVLLCSGSCDKRAKTNVYDGAKTCAIASSLYGGDTGCAYGCYGYGDCVAVCSFNAMHINMLTGLVEIDEHLCTGCGACLKACPKNILELRLKGENGQRIYVACSNKDKGAVNKNCGVACIGCSKCEKICQHNAIRMNGSLAYINDEKCTQCRECAPVCPTKAIVEVNF
jgi:Na+-translocating ferredoxin:NAD+ oxidoreductase RNF subunit RnfB